MIAVEHNSSKVLDLVHQIRTFLIQEKGMDRAIVNTFVAGYQFCIWHHAEEFDSFLSSISKPVPESIQKILMETDPADIDWAALRAMEKKEEGTQGPACS